MTHVLARGTGILLTELGRGILGWLGSLLCPRHTSASRWHRPQPCSSVSPFPPVPLGHLTQSWPPPAPHPPPRSPALALVSLHCPHGPSCHSSPLILGPGRGGVSQSSVWPLPPARLTVWDPSGLRASVSHLGHPQNCGHLCVPLPLPDRCGVSDGREAGPAPPRRPRPACSAPGLGIVGRVAQGPGVAHRARGPRPQRPRAEQMAGEASGPRQLLLSLADDTACKFCGNTPPCLCMPPALITVIEL